MKRRPYAWLGKSDRTRKNGVWLKQRQLQAHRFHIQIANEKVCYGEDDNEFHPSYRLIPVTKIGNR